MGADETIRQITRQLPSAKGLDYAVDGPILTRAGSSVRFLPGGVKVAQVTLTHLVLVRIQAGQPLQSKHETSRD